MNGISDLRETVEKLNDLGISNDSVLAASRDWNYRSNWIGHEALDREEPALTDVDAAEPAMTGFYSVRPPETFEDLATLLGVPQARELLIVTLNTPSREGKPPGYRVYLYMKEDRPGGGEHSAIFCAHSPEPWCRPEDLIAGSVIDDQDLEGVLIWFRRRMREMDYQPTALVKAVELLGWFSDMFFNG